jgi:hypothetical protein
LAIGFACMSSTQHKTGNTNMNTDIRSSSDLKVTAFDKSRRLKERLEAAFSL